VRILFWSSVFWPKIGGVEIHAAKLLPTLKARGYEYLVITTRTDGSHAEFEHYQDIPVHRLPFWRQSSYNDIDQLTEIRNHLIRLKRDFSPNLVHVNRIDNGALFYHLTRSKRPTPLLVSMHGEWPPSCDGLVTKTLRVADWVTGCSRAILVKAQQLVPEISQRSTLIVNALEGPPLPSDPLPFDPPHLLCLGRLSPEKGFDVAITAFRTVAQNFPQARLRIAGDGPDRAKLEQQTAQLGISQRADFLGWVEPKKVWALINSSTMVLMPSRQESLPLAALQAALMARPLVATRVGGLPEVVLHGQTGLLVNPEDPEALISAVAALLRNPALAARMGETARNRARQCFDWTTHVDRYDEIYQKLGAKERGVSAAH
jgi:glycosyltransferase involved in cell wall biosynthesis